MTQEYLPFFRKYRPQSFKDIVGQDALVKTLTGAIELNRISHAYLFCGPRGVGKTSTARIFAKSLNCVNGPTIAPCQNCPSCIEITNGVGIDVIEIDAATNRGIEDAKGLIEQTQYAPIKGKYKIFIIDEVHMLSKEAFNALLKTIEEPPKNVIFILATTEPHKVLETIVSRCQRFDLRRITTDDIVKKLREVSDIEGIKITDEALYTIAKNVSGGLRDSLALLDQVSILGLKEEVDKKTIEDMIGKITFECLFDITQTILKGESAKTFELLNNIYANGAEPRNFAENFIEFLRNALIVINSDENTNLSFINLNEVEISKLKQSDFNKDLIVKYIDKTLNFLKDIRNTTNPYLMVELLLIELCNINILDKKIIAHQVEKVEVVKKVEVIKKPEPKIIEKINEVKKNIEAPKMPEIPHFEEDIKPTVEEKKEKEPKIEENAQKNEDKILNEELSDSSKKQEIWDDIVNSIESIPAKCFFGDIARLVELNKENIKIGFLYANAIQQAKSDLKTKPFKKALSQFFDNEPNIQYIQIQNSSDYIKANLHKGAVQRSKIVQNEQIEEENFNNDAKSVQNDEKTTKKNENMDYYSSKTKEIIESFNGKVID